MAQAIQKSTVTKEVVYKSSGASLIWDAATKTWDDITGTWDSPGQTKTIINKSSVTLTAIPKS